LQVERDREEHAHQDQVLGQETVIRRINSAVAALS